MSYIIFIENEKRLKKYLESLDKDEKKELYFVVPSQDYDKGDFPKKSKVKLLSILLPPAYLVTEYVTDKIDKETFQNSYYQYLSRPLCHAGLNKIAKLCLLDGYNVVVCFGSNEKELYIPKYIKNAFDMIFPDLETFGFKDWKDDPRSVISYIPDDKDNIIRQIMADADAIGKRLQELDSCKDNYDKEIFYKE